MSDAALEPAFYFALGQAQRGVPVAQIKNQLADVGWFPQDIDYILYRVQQQTRDGRTPIASPESLSPTRAEQRTASQDGGHVSKALRQIVLNATDQTLDLDRVNLKGPVMLVSGGLILLGGLLGLVLLIAYDHSESIKTMLFPVIIGVTFIKAGIDTFLQKQASTK